MKLKKYVGLAMLMTLMIGLSNFQIVNASTIENEESSKTNITESIKQCQKHNRRGKVAFEKSIIELKNSGVLNDEDIKKIDEYNKKIEEKRKSEMKKKRDEVIDNMVNENVISHQKGEKLKQAVDKNIEQ
ncbi:hypothetical protein [Clostridium sp. CCUG 7971]|uniref:hypothetical protein n=1 Tax=Clostridium sp. CCUG 7971 TaxID=2811414 RepID=UPI001ABAFA8B|nr:hypothetical protein [Clostridium sp. CCUG 7971]MBO3443472.1 hypothetical protein [Clostridium sp. CCUG 7971]